MSNQGVIYPIYQIYGQTRISTREIGDDVINEDLWDTYLYVPGARMLINRMNSAMFHNGFNHNIEKDKVLQMMQGSKYKDIFGFSCLIVDGDKNVQAWMPLTDGIGYEMVNFDDYGECIQIRVTVQPKIGQVPAKQYFVDRADPENGIYEGFYPLRTLDGPPGERGLSVMLNLVDTLRVEERILMTYADYADIQGVAHPLYKVKDYDINKDAEVDTQVQKVKKGEAVIIDMENEYDYKSPQANAYDPVPVLDKLDEYVAREGRMNKHQLTGDPEGHLTSSITATANWFGIVKEEQEKIISQIRPVLWALGAPEDVDFNSPEEYSIEQQMNGVLLIRKGLDGLAKRENILKLINKHLGLTEGEELELAPEEEQKQINNEAQDNEYRGTNDRTD